eukprot:c18160_g1_i1.p1 GENE.c18160_g1_i1~~c18160_g1_i1.p1  ORF type:complete len:521 (+),score=113.19 c18160_g1_i1:177-1565(+)
MTKCLLFDAMVPHSLRLVLSCALLSCLILATIPIVTRLAIGLPLLSLPLLDLVVVLLVFIGTLPFASRVVIFVFVTVLHYWRRYRSLQGLGNILSSAPVAARCMGQKRIDQTMPIIDVSHPSSVFAWLQTRKVLRCMGEWYHLRLNAYVAGHVMLLVSMILMLLADLLHRKLTNAPRNQHDLLWQVLVACVTVLEVSFILVIVRLGTLTNNETTWHRFLLLNAQLMNLDEIHTLNLRRNNTTEVKDELTIGSRSSASEFDMMNTSQTSLQVLTAVTAPQLKRSTGSSRETQLRPDFDSRPGSALTPQEMSQWLPLPKLQSKKQDAYSHEVSCTAIRWAREHALGMTQLKAAFDFQELAAKFPQEKGGANTFAIAKRAVLSSYAVGSAARREAAQSELRAEMKHLLSCDRLLSHAALNLETDQSINPETFLGFAATSALTNSVITIVLSVVVAILNVFFDFDL